MDGRQFADVTRRLTHGGRDRRLLLRLAGAAVFPALRLLRPAPAAAAAVADAKCPAPQGCCAAIDKKRVAQTFIAKHSGRLTRAKVNVTSANPSNTDDYLFEIRRINANNFPGKKVLASVQVNDIVDPPTNERTVVTARFSPGANVEKGKGYALVITGVGGVTPFLETTVGDQCGGSLFNDDDLDNAFTEVPGADLVFATFVRKQKT